MDNTKSSAPYAKTNSQEQGLQLFRDHSADIWRVEPHLYRVPSRTSSTTVYLVTTRRGAEFCPCEDHHWAALHTPSRRSDLPRPQRRVRRLQAPRPSPRAVRGRGRAPHLVRGRRALPRLRWQGCRHAEKVAAILVLLTHPWVSGPSRECGAVNAEAEHSECDEGLG